MAFTLSMAEILTREWVGKKWVIRGDNTNYANLEWVDESDKPTEQALLDAELVAAKAKRIAEVKTEAQERIYATYPAWKQDDCALGFFDESTTTAIKSGINAVRTASNTAESDINALETVVAVMAFTW